MIEYTVKAYNNSKQEWRLHGQLHREDGPAIIYADGNGTQKWYLHGELHRADGPAVIWTNGYQEWWLNGKIHREDGPAVIYASGTQQWWLNGVKVTEAEHRRQTSASCAGKVVENDGTRYRLVEE